MALTSDVKDELARVEVTKSSTRVAELSAILRFAGGLHLISGRIVIEAEVDAAAIARRIRKDLMEVLGIESELAVIAPSGIRRSSRYQVRVIAQGDLLARRAGLIDPKGRPVRGLPAHLVSSTIQEAQALWRGAFLAHGSLTDPGRSASLEITAPGNEAAMALVGVARRLGVSAKAREVRGVHRVVVRDGEAIAAMLTQMGAHSNVLKWEEARLRREVRASANRLANFDDANLRRSAQAAVAAGARVKRALEILGSDIPEHLRYAGELRLKFKDASLDELGHHANPPMTKDAVAGRIRRLLAMADKKAEELGIPATDADLPEDLDD
ncbi:MAG: DNA-binding protein WhiA [Rhodoluna sp.]|nr:DNA-binding protein WhiA [Rhodoluna sp.]